MRVRTRSACVVLAWGILLILAAAGSTGSARPGQANTRTANSTTSTTSTTSRTIQLTAADSPATSPAGQPDAAAPAAGTRPAPRREAADAGTRTGADTRTGAGGRTQAGTPAGAGASAARPGRTYVVQPGDTLSGIAAALGTSGGWPALYAANREAIGPDPDLIRPGTALALPGGRATPARYTIAAGDTLSGIAAALGTRGGWPALYAANRRAVGPDPNALRPGTVLAIPRPAPPAPAAPRPGHRPAPAPATTPPPSTTPAPASTHPPAPARRPASANAPATAGLPRWLEIVLLAAGVLIGTAFLAEPALAIARRRRPAARPPAGPDPGPAAAPAACPPTRQPRILLADYDRLVVTSSGPDGMVCVLRPPGADPATILLAARLVLAQDRYEQLAGHLGMPAPRRLE